jgi:hypothetical protein
MSWYATFIAVCIGMLVSGVDLFGDLFAQERDQALKQKRDAWYARQLQQDCVDGPYDQRAIDAVQRAHIGDKRQRIFGLTDPYKRRAPSISILRTRVNPKGEGVIVTAWVDHNRQGMADYSRERWVWLVLDDMVYPLNLPAAGAIGRLFDGLPNRVQKRSGLLDTHERGRTILDQLGIEERTFERRFSGGNPFPTCK